ncbi:lactonase family protein [Brucella pseudogrignonensis]|uniref:lactonase family protein n=1 Tax=Brucella pseudogrignonensis TaxID=419475 RepID=UPI001E2F1019|nr:lactonase family protein [Brucella pseudogrignonensis]MCD4512117.1 lactonase family protein [Brucella pseudogrignonensis]
MIRIDPLTGQEFGRFPLRVQNGLDAMEPAADGKRAVLYCALGQRCTQDGRNALIVSLADGSELRQMDYDRYNSGPAFPGGPTPGGQFHFGAVFGDGGRTVISLDDEKILRLYRSDGERIAVLSQPQDRYNPHAASLIISPSGRYVMLWDAYGGSKGDRFVIWDARDGRHIQTLTAAGDYRVMSKPVWMRGDNGIFVLTRRGGKRTIDSFVLQKETEDKS